MPAIGTNTNAREGAKPKPAKKKLRKKAAPTVPDQADRTRQQTQQGRAPASRDKYRSPEEQQYLSQAHSVRIQARDKRTQERGTSPSGDRPQGRAKQMRSPAVQEGVRKARLRVKQQQGRGAGVRQIKAELEGRGALASLSGKIGDLTSHAIGTANSIQIPGVSNSGGARITNMHATNVAGEDYAKNFAKDLVNLPAQAVPSLYVPVAGAVEAAKGRPQRLRRLAKDVDSSDPLFNLGAAGVEALGGDSEAANRRLHTAEQGIADHPGYFAAEAVGAKGTLGRGIGRAGRTGALGKTVKNAAATTGREARTLPGTNLTVHREYSPDVFSKAGQVLSDRTRQPDTGVSVRDIRKRVDERVGATGTNVEPFVDEFAATKNGKVLTFPSKHAADRAAERQPQISNGHEFVSVPYKGVHAIVLKDALERLAEHGDVKPKTTAGRTLSLANDTFRKTVLTTSTSWAAGNVIEAAMRGALAKAGPRSYLTGLKVKAALKRIDPEKADELAARVTGGGHYSLAEKTAIQDIAQHYAGTAVEPMANALHNFWAHPVPRNVAKVWRTWNQGVFSGMRKLEGQFQTAQLGAALRRSEFMDGHLMKLGDKAIDEAARGLTNTETQVRFARAVERAYGKYQGFSPSQRMLVAHYSPFIAWFYNAVKFVGDVLPRDHPTTLAVIAAAENATEQWRQDHGLDMWMQGAVPGWLQGSIPTNSGGKIRASRFTPFGAFGDLGGTVAGQVLPLQMSPLMALKGLDWNGNKLKQPGDTEGGSQVRNALTAVGSFIDSTIPIVSQAKRIGDKGAGALNPFAEVGGGPTGKYQEMLNHVRAQLATLKAHGKQTADGIHYTPEYQYLLDQQRMLNAYITVMDIKAGKRKPQIRLKRPDYGDDVQ